MGVAWGSNVKPLLNAVANLEHLDVRGWPSISPGFTWSFSKNLVDTCEAIAKC